MLRADEYIPIVERAQKFIQTNYMRGKFDEDEGQGMRNVIIHNLVIMVMQDIFAKLKEKEDEEYARAEEDDSRKADAKAGFDD